MMADLDLMFACLVRTRIANLELIEKTPTEILIAAQTLLADRDREISTRNITRVLRRISRNNNAYDKFVEEYIKNDS